VGARRSVLAAAGYPFLLGCYSVLLDCRGEPRPERFALRNEPTRNEPARSELVRAEPIAPLPAAPPQNPVWVALGAQLFESTLVSGDGRVSCRSCHLPEHGFADRLALSRPAGRLPMSKNTPTLLNVAHLEVFNWDGRFSSLEDHLDALIQNPMVQATTWEAVAGRLAADTRWMVAFQRAFTDGLEPGNIRAALLAYERSLASAGAPFDRWLLGDAEALSSEAREGYALFKSRGCVSCHQGALVGGNLFARLGIMKPYYRDPGAIQDSDLGRFIVSARDEDRFVFRVPSLRNVASTAPYLHDGSLPTLDMAVNVMATYQLGRSLDRGQIERIVAFLESLTGSIAEGQP
jgi:cytochrome c peroxidase